MDPQIRNFAQLEKLMRENPREADAQAFEWQQFLKTNAPTSPELYSIETAEEFYKWVQEHPEKNIDPSVWVGKEISDSYYYLRDRHEDEQMLTEGKVDISRLPADIFGLPLMAAAFLEKPKIMQDDKNYQKIEENLKKEWLEKNPGKDFLSKEGLDYLYGSLDDHTKQSFAKDAENSFCNNPKFKKKVERYDKEKRKIYKDPKDDPSLKLHESITQFHINARLEYLKTHDDEKTTDKTVNLVRKKSQENFASRFPEKTKAYGQKVEGIQSAQEKIQINESLATYAAESGKEIKYVEKTHRDPSDISVSEATKILEKISRPQENQPYTISIPAPTESQVVQPPSSGRPSGGGINRGINTINNLARASRGFPNPLGKVGSRVVAQTALRGFAAFLAGPGFPIAITLGLVLFFVLIIIMGFGAAPPSETNNQSPNPTITPAPAP